MSEKEILKQKFKLYEKGKNYVLQEKYFQAIEILDKALSLDPEYTAALEWKGLTLQKLGKLEDSYQTFFKMNLIKLKKDLNLPSDINSIESWIEGAKELIKKGENQRAFTYLSQASFLSPIEDKTGGFMGHHNNANIYYYLGITYFNMNKNYEEAMMLLKRAFNLGANLEIPEDVKQKYEEFRANRSGKDVQMIIPLDTTNLKSLVPSNDKILCSTFARAQSSYSPLTSKQTTTYSWETHLLLTLNGIALTVAIQVSQKNAHYIPWVLVKWGKPRIGRTLWVLHEAGDLKYPILLTLYPNKGVDRRHFFEYIDNLKPIWEQRINEMKIKIENNLKKLDSLEFIPKYGEYTEFFERVPKSMYRKVRKKVKKKKKKVN